MTRTAYERWLASIGEVQGHYSEELLAQSDAARRNLTVQARDWLDAGGGEVAYELCLLGDPSMKACAR